MTTDDLNAISAAIGRTRTVADTLSPEPACALAAAFDGDATLKVGDALPPLRHWLHFREYVARSQTGVDGHPKLGDFLPAIPFPRRMWAGGSLRFHRAPLLGSAVERVTRIEDFQFKQGRNGDLLFATLGHQVRDAEGVAIEEVQDLVYRPAATVMQTALAPPPAAGSERWDWEDSFVPDPVLLFRFSAVTNNSHRIHYDLDYAREAEFYPNLVVHGPLTAILLIDSARRATGQAPTAFRFRGVSPLYVDEHLMLSGRESGFPGRYELEARTREGRVVMSATFDTSAVRDGPQ